jgi:retinol dehydrogenase-13
VILACRDEEKGREAAKDIHFTTKNKNVHCYKLDLASFESIRSFATVIIESKFAVHM